MQLKGLIITKRAQEWLQKSHSMRILHLFDNSCNLVNAQDEVLSLVTAVIGSGPFSIVVDDFNRYLFNLHMPITINNRGQKLLIGNIEVDFSQADRWQSQPDWKQLRSLQLCKLPAPQMLSSEIEVYLTNLCTGIETADSSKIRDSVFHLAGRGSGLTPTGDDILMGVIYGLWVWRPDVELIRLICDTAVTRTTTLSAAFLKAAANGEATIHWHDFVNAKPNAIQNILNIGHTSGTDTLAGFTHICQILIRLYNNQNSCDLCSS